MTSNFDGWQHMDWFVEIDTLEFNLVAIKSHNENNPDVGAQWTEWPKGLSDFIALPLGYYPSKFDETRKLDSKMESKLKVQWIEFAQFINEHECISLDGNTFTIDGNHGSKFTFDASMEFSLWLPPNTIDEYGPSLRAIRNGARGKSNLGTHMEYLSASHATWKIDTGVPDDGLGWCDFPLHMKELNLKQYEAWSTFIYPTKETFPENLTYLIELLIEDYHIWEILHDQEVKRRKELAEWNEKWPNGRPDDWMYL